jgi:hypothetical protein
MYEWLLKSALPIVLSMILYVFVKLPKNNYLKDDKISFDLVE